MKNRVGRILLFLAAVISSSLAVQSGESDSEFALAQRLYKLGNELQLRAQYDSAITHFDSAGILYGRLKMAGDQILCRNKTASCLQSKGNFDNALSALSIAAETEQQLLRDHPLIAAQRLLIFGSILRNQGKYDTVLVVAHTAAPLVNGALKEHKESAWDLYTLFAGTYFNLGELDSSFNYSYRALQLFPNPTGDELLKVSGTYNGIAGAYEARGDYTKALEYYSQSLDLQKKILGEKHPDISNLLNNVATVHFRAGDYDLSLEYYMKSLSIMTDILPADHPAFGIRYNNIAMSYRRKKDFEKALEYGIKSKSLFTAKLGNKHPNVAGVINNIGRTYYDMQRYEQALESYQQARAIWEEKLGKKHVNVTQSYFNIGEVYGSLKDYQQSKQWLETSLAIRRETLGEQNAKTAQSYNALAKMYAAWGKSDSALLYYQSAIMALTGDSTAGTSDLRTIKNLSDPDLFLSLSGKADLLFSRGYKNNNREDIKASLYVYDQAARLVDFIRRGFGTEGSKLQLSQNSFTVYERAVSAALSLFEMTKNDSALSAAFSFAERSKAGILMEAITELNAKKFSGIPDSLLEQESAIRTAMTYYETQLQKEKEKKSKTNKEKIRQYENQIFALNRNNEQLIVMFEREYPQYYSLKHQSETVSMVDVQKLLPDNKTALLEYIVGDTTVTIFSVTKKRCIAVQKPLSALNILVKQFRQSIQNLEQKEYGMYASSLYKQLIDPVKASLKGIQTLYIVPDGILNHVPFEALLTQKQKNVSPLNFASLPYMIHSYEIRYVMSARLLEENLRSVSATDGAFIGFAPVFADRPAHSNPIFAASAGRITRSRTINGERFVELKESEHEVKNISHLFEAERKPVHIALHREASESLLKSVRIRQGRYIHIATHGIINEEHPKLSGIVLAAPEAGSLEDGILYSGEIYNLHLTADLVVLSACETGLGTIVRGEGLMGLTRGFMYAGAKNLLVSLWQVADKSTAELMVLFYQNILAHQSYSTALRNAKITMIKRGTFAHPVEWSPFILTGK